MIALGALLLLLGAWVGIHIIGPLLLCAALLYAATHRYTHRR